MAKPFTWSYSRLKNFETCPRKHYEVDIAKNYKEAEGEALTWGNRVHATLAGACQGTSPLPPEMETYQPWVDRVKTGSGELKVEQKYAITKDFQPTAWFANNVWYRGIADVARVNGDVALALDWKTGKVLDDTSQLMLMAQCIFVHYPEVNYVRSEYIWLKDDAATSNTYARKDIHKEWVPLLPRVERLEHAHVKQEYPPKPDRHCRWCPVESCPHNGKGGF